MNCFNELCDEFYTAIITITGNIFWVDDDNGTASESGLTNAHYYKLKCDLNIRCNSLIYHKLLLIKHCLATYFNDKE